MHILMVLKADHTDTAQHGQHDPSRIDGSAADRLFHSTEFAMKFTTTGMGLSILLLLSLSGCATVGNESLKNQTASSVQQTLTQGQTTREQLRAALGDPSSVSYTDSGMEIWTYQYARSVPRAQSFIPVVNLFSAAADVKTKQLVVLLDQQGVVAKYAMRESDTVARRGIVE